MKKIVITFPDSVLAKDIDSLAESIESDMAGRIEYENIEVVE